MEENRGKSFAQITLYNKLIKERLKIALHSDSTSEEVFDELKIKL